jgi:hypothetical protein
MNTVRTFLIATAFLVGTLLSCMDMGSEQAALPVISSDEALFNHVTQTDPFTSYTLFPNADSIASGTLNGSTAHQPLVRVSLNARAFSVLENGSLPPGSDFPDGSIVFKQIIMNGETVLYAVMRKESANPLSANGWLWAEYHTDGTVAVSVTKQGSGCVGCHALEQGPQHDFVRTFERQR